MTGAPKRHVRCFEDRGSASLQCCQPRVPECLSKTRWYVSKPLDVFSPVPAFRISTYSEIYDLPGQSKPPPHDNFQDEKSEDVGA
ncbi:Hypothetical protein NTJ_12598 [Nesidiocoris tenuis]|uniref:Uncharacterized protein n=1 Tax=Nesidiocoris tenuis TaxID=355587 RepID=A0ABN7B9D7_9HEMI|nr:Hypothetical protein NTJ_12598 [Nesidiocoris tenuis]